MDPERPCVLEISSFQLERLPKGRPFFRGGILTNLTANHLDRHKTFAAYRAAKARIFELTTAESRIAVNGDDPESRALASETDIAPRAVTLSAKTASTLPPLAYLSGPTNRMNFLLAVSAATMFSDRVGDGAIRHVAHSFRGIEHRLESFAVKDGVLYVNDSKATTPEATHAAVGAFTRPIHLIAGGYDKKLPKDRLLEDFFRCRSVFLIGATAAELAEEFRQRGGQAEIHDTLESAVRAAATKAVAEDVVLLSPAHPSYGLFTDYRARGQAFRKAVLDLGGKIEVFPPALSERPD